MELLANPFCVLGATMRDGRRRILELAEEKSLVSDEDLVRDARATLTNPRRRIAAEVGWLPGLGPKRVDEALVVLDGNSAAVRTLGNLPTLARANLLADGLVRAVETLSPDDAAEWIVQLAEAHDELDVEETARLLNEERSVAGFPAISDDQHVDEELQSRRDYFRRTMMAALDLLPSDTLVKVVTMAVEQATDYGARHAPILIDDLVDSFEVEAQGILETEAKAIAALVQGIRTAAADEVGTRRIATLVNRLDGVVRNWDTIAQPMQVSARSRGLSHDQSHEVAGEIRRLAVELFNEHDLLEFSRRLTVLQQEVFAEVDSVLEQSEEDASALDEIAEHRAEQLAEIEARAESWKREITYEADVGTMFKEKLRISPEGVQWKGYRIPLEKIRRVRWGGIRHSLNGIPTGTTYEIFVGDERDGVKIELRKEQVYSPFIERLWKATGARLLTEMLEGLKEGKQYRFGTALVADRGVELERRRLFSANERVLCQWSELTIWNGAGTFCIAKRDDKKVAVELVYLEVDNAHILEAAIRVFWKRFSERISDLLQQDQ